MTSRRAAALATVVALLCFAASAAADAPAGLAVPAEGPASRPGSGSLVPKPSAPDPRPFTLEDRYLDAAQRGDLKMIQLCLDKGVDPKTKDSIGRSALLLAAREAKNLEVVKFLHDKGLAADEPDATGRSPLADAAGNGDVTIVSWLIEQKADLERKDAQGRTPIFGAAIGGSAPTVARLIEAGAKVNVRDNYEDTPLIDACNKGNDEVARLLVEKGADPSLKDQEGRTARERAPETAKYCRSLGEAKPPPAAL
ncbi:MAG: ankyrin repeat domain-containing protein [Candidatus Binatia bacterium]